jgi:hypothetical protein
MTKHAAVCSSTSNALKEEVRGTVYNPTKEDGNESGFDNKRPVKVAIFDASTDKNAYGWLDNKCNAKCPSGKM